MHTSDLSAWTHGHSYETSSEERAERRTLAVVIMTATMMVAEIVTAAIAETPLNRTILGLYDSKADVSVRRSPLHRLVEMPLNHLGLIVQPHDISQGLPSQEAMLAVRGIITWLAGPVSFESDSYIEWLESQIRAGKKLVIIDHPGVDPYTLPTRARAQFDAILAHIGLRWESEWVNLTYSSRIVFKDATMVEFERALPPVLPPYQRLSVIGNASRVYLRVRRDVDLRDTPLVMTGQRGGYISSNYAIAPQSGKLEGLAWHVNPFRFFREAFGTDDLPKLDTTTMSGRRIYYSHVDGDGWHNVSTAIKYASRRLSSAEILFLEVLQRTPDLPITVAPISADLDSNWYGDERSRDLARKIFALPQVEAGSHTQSHPLVWDFFRDPDPRRELRYLPFYPARPGRSQRDSVWQRRSLPADLPPRGNLNDEIPQGYVTPRSYAVQPFSLEAEVSGSVRVIEELLPPGKRVTLFQWSGDTSPFEGALALVRRVGLRNINGGDSRMDGLFASYAQVQPLALKVGDERQVFSSASNENTYTDNWQRRFFGFRGLAETLDRMESPIRVKPINLYYHFYSLEREDSLKALWHNIEYARRQEIAPISTSRFVAMVDGFHTARITSLGNQRWRIEHREAIETVRFDNASQLAVDFSLSDGVIGQRHFQGSLYVALDSRIATPVVALKTHDAPHRDPVAPTPYLVHSRWRVYGVTHSDANWRYIAEGFGRAEFIWNVPTSGRYSITVSTRQGEMLKTSEADAKADGTLRFDFSLLNHNVDGVQIAVDHRP